MTVTRHGYTPQRAESPAPASPQVSSPYDTPRRDSAQLAAAATGGYLHSSPLLSGHLPSPYSGGHGDGGGGSSSTSASAANRVAHITHQLRDVSASHSSSPSGHHRALSHRRVPSLGAAASSAAAVHNINSASSGSSGAASAASSARGLGLGLGLGHGSGALAAHHAHASSPVSHSRALPSSARTHSSGAGLDAEAEAEGEEMLALRALSDAEQDEEDMRERRFVANSRRGSLQLQAQQFYQLQQQQNGDTVPAAAAAAAISHRSSSLTRPSPPPAPSAAAAAGRSSSLVRHNGSNHNGVRSNSHNGTSGTNGGSGSGGRGGSDGGYYGLTRAPTRGGGRIRGLVGLANLGNTCFLASSLQCLLSTPGLLPYFASGSYEQDVNASPKASRTRGALARAFGALAQRVVAAAEAPGGGGGQLVERPLEVKRAVSLADSKFLGYGQHDSHEFCRVLLAALHDELNRVAIPPAYVEIKDGEGDSDEVKAARWWANYAERNDSVVSHCFAGQLQSSLVCQKCKGRSEAFDPFMDLSLPIPKARGGGLGAALSRLAIGSGGGGGGSSGARCTLSDCFGEFVKEELLTGNEQVYCRRCRAHRDQSKRLRIRRWPRVLLLHLKRFSYNGHMHARAKIDVDVDFPTHIDLTHMQTEGDEQPPAMSVQMPDAQEGGGKRRAGAVRLCLAVAPPSPTRLAHLFSLSASVLLLTIRSATICTAFRIIWAVRPAVTTRRTARSAMRRVQSTGSHSTTRPCTQFQPVQSKVLPRICSSSQDAEGESRRRRRR